jgi:Raf kinase inhibitor-like YbhB/YbcL family protein
MKRTAFVWAGVVVTALVLCVALPGIAINSQEANSTMAFQLTSPSFAEGQMIPVRHTCDGPDLSPPLNWSTVPEGTMSLALICDDPDAPMGTWVHWVIYNIPAGATGLPENLPKVEQLPDGTCQGMNDFRQVGYGGPCPPPGSAHRYYFTLYALSGRIEHPGGLTKARLLQEMNGHILASTRLMGRYQRQH